MTAGRGGKHEQTLPSGTADGIPGSTEYRFAEGYEAGSAYVPAELPIAIDANGDVVVPQNAKIINGVENLPIGVEAIDVTMEDGWTLASMSDDLASETKDTKKVAMEVLGQDLSDAASFSPAKIEANGDIALNMKTNLPDQSASSQTKIATIGFTVNWWEDQDSTPTLNATNELSKAYMDPVLKSLTGNITFSTEGYDPEQHTGTATDISEAQDGSVMAVVNGQDAVVYSEGGTLAPENSIYLFKDYESISISLAGLDTSKVTNMRSMFYDAKITDLDLNQFNTSKVSNMYAMFDGVQLDKLDLSQFDTSNVTAMEYMFSEAKIDKLNLIGFDTSHVKNMSYMFSGAKIDTIDLSSFDMSQVSSKAGMFSNCTATTVYCRSEADAAIMKASSNCPSTINFVVKQ